MFDLLGSHTFKIARMYLFTGVLKTYFLLFQIFFKSNQGNK